MVTWLSGQNRCIDTGGGSMRRWQKDLSVEEQITVGELLAPAALPHAPVPLHVQVSWLPS